MAYESGWDELMRQGAQVMGNTVKGIVAGIGEKIGGLFSSAEPAVAATTERSSGGFLSRMIDAISSNEPEIAAPAVGQKLGLGARDAAIVAAMESQPKPPNFASRGDIGELPIQFTNVAMQRPLDISQGASV